MSIEKWPRWYGPGFVVRYPRDWEYIETGPYLNSGGELLLLHGKKTALVGQAGVGQVSHTPFLFFVLTQVFCIG